MCFLAFTKSKSANELASNLEMFANRYIDDGGSYDGPKVMWVDNPGEVSSFYEDGNEGGSFSGFNRDGHEMLVLNDPFHALQTIGKTLVKNHPLTAKFQGISVSSALFTLLIIMSQPRCLIPMRFYFLTQAH